MATPNLSDLTGPAKNFARLVFLIVIIAIFSVLFSSGKDFLISNGILKKSIDQKEVLIDGLSFDYKVTKVVDGDTIKIERLDGGKVEGREEKMTVRLIGINTPETVDPRKPVECFGKEASDYMHDIAKGKVAAIEIDPSQDKFDQYGRLLAYIYVKNSGAYPNNVVFLNEKMIKDGYAYEYTYNTPYKYQTEFKNLQNEARNKYKGLWSTNTCDGLKTPVASPPSE